MFITRMRWKAICNNKANYNSRERYGLKALKRPKQVKELVPFENDLIDMLKVIKFRKVKNQFLTKLKNNIKTGKQSKKTLTFADKTSNMYRLSKEQHELLTNAVTSNYKKANNSIKKKINMAGKQILKNNEILNRIEINGENNCFFTLKDHKDNFANNPQVRLINPAKNELGRISKVILDKINLAIREHFSFNQWKNTQNVIDWFNKIPNKKVHKFVVFDIKEFYPLNKEQLLKEALDFSNSYINILKNNKKIINHARKSLLFNKQQTYIKKESGLFDVTMGAYDRAEVCELVGSFLLYALSLKCKKTNIGLYRDDGLAVFRYACIVRKLKKQFQKFFPQHGLKLIVKCTL